MVKITTKSGQVIETEDSFSTIQRAMSNKTLIEISMGTRKMMINPETIESIEAEKEATNSIYKLNAGDASNFPFQQTPEQIEAMQMKMQPMKAMFDAKKQAMNEMKAQEDAALNNAYMSKYAGYIPSKPAEASIAPTAPIVEAAPKKRGPKPKVK